MVFRDTLPHYTTFFLSAIMLIPLAALVIKGSTPGFTELKEILLDPRAPAIDIEREGRDAAR